MIQSVCEFDETGAHRTIRRYDCTNLSQYALQRLQVFMKPVKQCPCSSPTYVFSTPCAINLGFSSSDANSKHAQ